MANASSLIEKVKKLSGNPMASLYSESPYRDKAKYAVPLDYPMLNVCFSGHWDGGLLPGITVLGGSSGVFKSALGCILASSFQKHYEDGVVLFLDSELGATKEYFNRFGMDEERTIHIPISNIEEAKFESMKILDGIDGKEERLFILFDSLGNTASKKEVEDAVDEKSVADMSRAKAVKSYFRCITPLVNFKNVYCCVINHTYKTMSMFPTDVVGGGTGSVYSADNIFIINKSKEKDKETKDIVGYTFSLSTFKSRYVKEGAKFPLNINFEQGLDKYSGLWDFALANGFIEKVATGWYSRKSVPDDKKWREGETHYNADFWEPVLTPEFIASYEKRYSL